MKKQDAASEAAPKSPSAPQAIESIRSVVDSLSETLVSIKAMCATAPDGAVRERLSSERSNDVLGMVATRIAAMRPSLDEAETPAPSKR